MSNQPAVSVVVPVYSPGPYIRPLLDSLDSQIPPPDGFEAILVDDGSTDATGDLIERWAVERPWCVALRLPNSGWPSHPRNVGIERSRGEFVFFVDHDDWLADDALDRMTAFARRHESDVVVGAMRGRGRNVPVRLFRQTVGDARPPSTPLQDSMTVHAMFRTSFLRETGLRFDESLRRLEDHVFMAEAYTRARRVSVLAGTPVYFHIARDDNENAGHRPYDPHAYYSALGRAVEIVLHSSRPPAERHAYLGRWMRVEMLDRLRSEAIRALPPNQRMAFFTEVRRLLLRMPDDAVRALPAAYRSHAHDIRDGHATEHATASAGKVGARARLVETLAHAAPWMRRRVVAWARSPAVLLRSAAAAGAVVAAVAAVLTALPAPFVSAGLVALSALLTGWLSVRSLSPWPTAGRQVLALAPAVVAAHAHDDLAAGVAVAITIALVAVGVAADLLWRRRDVRAYPAHRGGPFARLGWIGLTSCALGAVVTATSAFALLR